MKIWNSVRRANRAATRQMAAAAVRTAARAAIEPLEGRAYMSITVGVRLFGGGQAVTVSKVGQVVNLQAYATISGSTAGSNDGLGTLVGSLLGTKTSSGGVIGDWSANVIPTFTGNGASNGTIHDLNGDGGKDVGSNDSSTTDNFLVARAGNVVSYDGVVSGDSNTIIFATATYTVTSLNGGAATDLAWRSPPGIVDGSASGLYVQDGQTHQIFASSDVTAGPQVVITASGATPTPTPTPTATKLSGTVIGTSGSYNNSGNTAARAEDGNLSTYFDGPSANGNYVGLDLGSTYAISSVAYASRSGWASRMNGGVFQASNSSTFAGGVVTLYTIGGSANPSSTSLTTQTVSSGTGYRYVRYLSPAGSYGDTSEVQFFGKAAAASPTPTPTGTKLSGTVIGTTGSYGNSGNTAAKAFDGNLGTYFDAPSANGDWIGLDLGTEDTITSVAFASRSGFAGRMNGGTFQASNTPQFTSGVVNLYTIGNSANPSSTSLTTVGVNASGYRYVRYLAPSGSYGDVSEVQFYGSTGSAKPAEVRLNGTTGGTSGSYGNSGNTVARATDGNLSSYFDGPSANGNVVTEDLYTAQVIDQISFAPRSGYASRLVGGSFQASTTSDFSSGVTTLYTIKSAPSVGSLTTVTVSSPVAARYVRYVSPAGSYGDVAEVQFFE